MGIIIRQSVKGTAATYIGAFIGFITTVFIQTKYLAPEDIGLYRVIIDIASMFSTLSLLGVTSSAIRFFPYFKNKNNNNNGFFYYLMLLPTIGCFLFIVLFILLKVPVSAYFIKESSLIVDYYYWVIPLIIVMTYLYALETYANINMRITFARFNREIWIRVMTLVVFLIYGYHLITRSEFITGVILTYAIALITIFIYTSRIANTSLKHDYSLISKPLRRDILKYSSVLVTGVLGTTIISKLDILMVASQLGLSSTGIYSIAMYIGAVIEIPSRSIIAISSPIAAENIKNNDWKSAKQLYKKVSLHQLLIGGLLFILIWVNIDNIFAIIPNGETYVEGKWVVFFIGMSKMITVMFNFGGSLISFSKYYHWTLYFTFFSLGVGILANYWLISIYGITGASIAMFVLCVLNYGFQQWIIFRKLKGNPWSTGMTKLLAIMLALFVVNYFITNSANPIVDGLIRTIILSVIACTSVYFLKVSDDLNNTIRTILNRIKSGHA